MTKVKIIGIAPAYNEIERGNLDRFLINIPKVVDGLVLLDDASTDGTYERMLEVTPNVIRNEENRFIYEQENTEKLIAKALEIYPDLTHILTLNIDSSFPPMAFKDGEAALHQLMRARPRVEMWMGRNVHLWRSHHWYRCDKQWATDKAERIYVRKYSLKMASTKPGLHQGKVTDTKVWASITDFVPKFATLHWGFSNKDLIVKKFHYYMSKEKDSMPIPKEYEHKNVFKLLDEWNLELKPVEKYWIDPDIKLDPEIRKPKPISYYRELKQYNLIKAKTYKRYYFEMMGEHIQEERYE